VLLMAATDVALRMRSESLLTVLKSVAQACATGELVKAVYDCLIELLMIISFGFKWVPYGTYRGVPRFGYL